MASTTLPSRNPAPGARPGPSIVPGGGRQRRWSLALVAILVTLGSALAFVVLWMNAGGRKPVLALRNDVLVGQEIQADDLTVVRVSTDGGLRPIPSSQRDEVIGKPAAGSLLAGSLLVWDAVGTADNLDAGTAVIAVPVPRTELPSEDLESGDKVVLYRTVDSAQAGEFRAETIGEGVVASVQSEDDASDVRVSVTIDDDIAPDVANAVREDQIYLSQIAGG